MSHNLDLNAGRQSDGCVVPAKFPNKGRRYTLAEGMKGRQPTKENAGRTAAFQMRSRGHALAGLHRVREAAKREKRLRFTAILHHVSVALLSNRFYALKQKAAPGVDGSTWQEYDGPGQAAGGLARSHTPGHVSCATFQESPHSQAGWATATSGHSHPKGQNRSACSGDGPQPDLRGGLPGVAAPKLHGHIFILVKHLLSEVNTRLGQSHLPFIYLANVFGPDEIQLCEIQAAGPQVSGLVNALLEGCFDNKFEIRFRTQRPKADGRGMVDDFDVEVRNRNLDRTCLVDELSGGQFVLVNEAVNLGSAIYNMRQGEGIHYETLFRDETVGALDAVNAKEHVRMLRRAMDLGGFHQVIFICHTSLVWKLADRVLSVHDGSVVAGDREMAGG